MICFSSFGQKTSDKHLKLNVQLLTADSVFIISHDDTNGWFDNPDGSITPLQSLILDGKINRNIVHEIKVVSSGPLKELSKILTSTATDVNASSCFSPHHSVVMYKNGDCAYIAFCFQCQRVRAHGVDFAISDMDDLKWKRLRDFLKNNGLSFKL